MINKDRLYLEPEGAFTLLENPAVNFFLFGAGLHVGGELSDVIVFWSVVLVQYLDRELGVARHVLDLPELVPYGL